MKIYLLLKNVPISVIWPRKRTYIKSRKRTGYVSNFHRTTLFLELRFRGVAVNILPPLKFKIVHNHYCDFKIILKGISSYSHTARHSHSRSLSKTRLKTTTTMVDNDSPGLLIIHGEDEPCSDDECGTNSARSVSFDTTEINADIQNLHSPLTPSGEENLRPLASEQGETVPAPQPPPPLLSPPRQLYDSSHDSLVSQEVLVDIIENTDLKKKNSVKTELYRRALPQLRFTIHKSTSKASQSYHRSKYMGRGYHFHCIVWPAQSRRTKT